MAYIIPSDISQLALAGGNSAELETLKRLKTDLPQEYTVFHGVHWSRSYDRHTIYGELDFVVVNGAGDTLVIEQKNGRLVESGSALLKDYDGTSKDVGDQIRRSLENIREKFNKAHGSQRRLKIDYLIFCPDHRVSKLKAAALDRNRIVDATEVNLLGSRISEILGSGDTPDPEWRRIVEEFFCQTFEVAPDIHAHIKAQQQEFTTLSGGLVEFLSNLEMSPLRLRIKGTAGCGKSQLARHFFEQAPKHGKRPLLVCFNRPLKERLAAILGNDGLVMNFHGLCDAFLQDRGHKIDFDRAKTEPNFWHELGESVIGETVPEAWKFDTLIVDEGQDFEQDWLEILWLFLREVHDLVWLEDPDQNVYGKRSVSLVNMVEYHARWNYRSPERIVRFIGRALPFEFECGNHLPGLGVEVLGYSDPRDQPKMVAKIAATLLR